MKLLDELNKKYNNIIQQLETTYERHTPKPTFQMAKEEVEKQNKSQIKWTETANIDYKKYLKNPKLSSDQKEYYKKQIEFNKLTLNQLRDPKKVEDHIKWTADQRMSEWKTKRDIHLKPKIAELEKQKLDEVKEKLKNINNIKDKAEKAKKPEITALEKTLTKKFEEVKSKPVELKKLLWVASGIVILSLITIYLYKNYLSPAAKACKGKEGEDHNKCMEHYRRQALEKIISDLRSKLSQCDKTDHPEKCKINVNKLINKYENQLKDL